MEEPKPRRPWRRRKRTWIAGALWLLVPPALLFGFVIWHGTASAIAPAKMTRLHVGMTNVEVRELLGEPEVEFPRDDGGKQGVFSRMTWAGYYIEFGPDGRTVRHWHDY